MEVNGLPTDSFENNTFLKQLQAQLRPHGKKYLCAYSGGLDSTVLLHAAARSTGIELRAVHIHHGLHPNADSWAEHCARVCRDLDVKLIIVKVDVRKDHG